MAKYRVGIDVGGTFTDAVAVNNDTYELIGQVKVPTTHFSEYGVSEGIVISLQKLMKECGILPEEITFIAHGTTQATNALLEGDVASVGIVAMGAGIEGMKTKTDTNMGQIEIAEGKYLKTHNVFINTAEDIETQLKSSFEKLENQKMESIVASEAFSVDNPENENKVVEFATKQGIPATAGHDVSKLYGLKVRTRTAVVNASILPKMIETADMTEESIKKSDIKAPLMIMRCDGGVMTVDEVRTRPILTILSGPSAGVAGALMYEKLTDGIFLEVGGTSTDISCVRDGNVMLKYASIGGHDTYLNSLDVRTVGIGGGSMVQIENGKIKNVGPRSAHIANLEYEVFTEPEKIVNPVLKTVSPMEGDPTYAYIECENGVQVSLTLSGAANICGYVSEADYASGFRESAVRAWAPLAKNMNMTVEETAKLVLDLSAKKNSEVINKMIQDYQLNQSDLILVGGGGGASTVVPHLGEYLKIDNKIAENAPVISPIGVALAMVRDMVERTVTNPTEQDVMSIRAEAIKAAMNSGATEESIEVRVEIDSQTNKLRAIATGATELRSKTLGQAKLNEKELCEIVATNLKKDVSEVDVVAKNETFTVITSTIKTRKFFIFPKTNKPVRVIDNEGVIRLQKINADVTVSKPNEWRDCVNRIMSENTVYGDGGAEIPNLYILNGPRIIDLSGMRDNKQIISLCEAELTGVSNKEDLIFISTLTTENQRG